MNVLLLQLDGELPNIALMRISTHHKRRGDQVELRRVGNPTSLERGLWDNFDKVYAGLIFLRTRPLAERLKQIYPEAIVGGTGWDWEKLMTIGTTPAETVTLESIGIREEEKDYSLYPGYLHSIGYTQRGCRLNQKTCPWCCVPVKEGGIRPAESLRQLWRGDPYPRNLHLLDNDFFGNPEWRSLIAEMREGGFKVSFNQGVNIRLMNEEQCAAVASVRYYNSKFDTRRFYTAWDNKADEERLFRGLAWLTKHGMKADHLMVYMLIGHEPGETHESRDYRRARLRDFGARPYPMPYVRTQELVGFQRWVVGAYDKRVPWDKWLANKYQPEGIR